MQLDLRRAGVDLTSSRSWTARAVVYSVGSVSRVDAPVPIRS